MARLAFCEYHNMIAILDKYEHNVDFSQIVDFVEASHLRYALTLNPTVNISHIRQFWSTARVETSDEETKILATVDGKPRTISESSIRRNLKLKDEAGISSLSDAELFENLTLMGRAKIAQSLALPTTADEPTSPLGDDSQGEACLTVSGLEAEQDKANIIKSSTLPHDSTPRVTSLAADEGKIISLKARIKMLKDKDAEGAEPSGDDTTIKGRSLEIGEEVSVEKSTKKDSNDTEELVNVLTSLDAASILTSGGVQVVSVPPTTEVPTVSVPTGIGMVSTASLIFTTASMVTPYSRRKGKEKMVELDTPKKKRDVEIARIHAEEELQMLIDSLDRNNEMVAKYLQEYEQFAVDLSIGERIDLINDLVKYQDNYAKVLKLEQDSAKKVKTSKEVSEEDLKTMMQLVPVEEVYVEALQTLVKETLSIRQATNDKEKELWVKLKRLYEPDVEDQLWTQTQALMHDPVEWRLYDTCGVHDVLSRDQEIFMLVDKEYPLRKGLTIVMINNKLQVENYSQMANDLILKIHKIANSPRQRDD
nr:hypothetical protein [Tanacetum cinerariifolium]